jgi:hypothetical protein
MSKRLGRGRRARLAAPVAVCLALASCGGDGGSGVTGGNASGQGTATGANAFPTLVEDHLPTGARVDVSALNLFPMGAGDRWIYNDTDDFGSPSGVERDEVTSGPDASGRLSLTATDPSGSDTSVYVVSADGLLNESILGDAVPPTAASIIGPIFEYVTPLYAPGEERLLVRSGPWGADLDGDGIQESFRFEYSQISYEPTTLLLPGSGSLSNVVHFRNTIRLTLRPSKPGSTDVQVTVTEEANFAPGIGKVTSAYTTTDSTATFRPSHNLVLASATVGGVPILWASQFPVASSSGTSAALDGQVVDINIAHRALVYDGVRSKYYASIPGSAVEGANSIATIDPATGGVSYSALVGSEPTALALAADGSALYVGLDGTGEVAKLALPSMAELGRVQLPVDAVIGQSRAETIAASPVEPGVFAVSTLPSLGTVLVRDMILQPKRTPSYSYGYDLLAFDALGSTLYGLDTQTSEFGLRRVQVLDDGLIEQLPVSTAPTTGYWTQSLAFVNGRVIAGSGIFAAADLSPAGAVTGAIDCWPERSGARLFCVDDYAHDAGRMMIVDPQTLEVGASLYFYAPPVPSSWYPRVVQGPAGQVAFSYRGSSTIRLFSSPRLP